MAVEQVTEQVADQVADHLEEVAEVTRRIDGRLVSYFLGGIGVGAVVGFFVGYRFNREKIKAEAFKESEEEIAQIREHYQSKIAAIDNAAVKEGMSDLVVEEGYAHIRTTEEMTVPVKPSVPVNPPKVTYRSVDTEKDKNDGWAFPRELAQRTPDRPYIIHQDEFAHNESEYDQVTYTYYAGDDILLDEHEEIIMDRDSIVGRGTLNRFGHGTDDFNIVYVRNPVLESEIEICRSPGSYEIEVLGLEPEPQNDESS